ncbi:hypothetical protein [Microbacterium aerolatum]|uniref:Sox C-terminal domain-containing protein n=1 Tax=Microbacterium aerolatum TaxID=153731 RepID=A0A511AID5_9MICO|nr:hypothetical protein [Microbacterium aerolatum]GEK86491.1 hypothetical protein MAE01_16670 [Microbacterium aerolatum]GGB23306.1 hypothetical protein GCM10007198_12180 [Microbacterium aerolatum]
MVDPQRARYIAGVEGAPPVPPPGGYHGARRTSAPTDAPSPIVSSATVPKDKQPANAIGWVALLSAILFALVLLSALLAGGTELLYGATMLALQLIVLGVVVAAVLTPRGRVLGASALVITLLLNVATVGAASALQTSASGSYDGQKSAEQKHEEAFPGIKDISSSQILAQPSLEQVRAQSDAALAEIRERLSDRYGYTWTEVGPEDLRPERNGYGGESMLVQYISVPWMTNEPIQDYDRKLDVMSVIQDVLVEYGMYGMYSFNDPSSNLDDAILQRFYGSNDPRTQHTWEWYTDNYPDPMRFYAVMYDLSNDPAGELRAEREADSAKSGEPLEGLQIYFLAPELLSEADRAEFEQRLQEYPGF